MDYDDVSPAQPDVVRIVDANLRHGFAQVPRPVLRAKGLSPKAKLVYAALLDYAWQAGSCFPGQQRLADDLDVSLDTVQRALQELRAFQLVAWERRGLTKPNIYAILPLSDCPHLDLGASGNRNQRSQETADSSALETAGSGAKKTQAMRTSEQTQGDRRVEHVNDETAGPANEFVPWPPRPAMPPVPLRPGTGVEAIGAVLDRRDAPVVSVAPPGEAEEDRTVIAAYVGEVARQFGDRLPAAASARQALALYRRADTNRAAFLGMLFQAQAVTKARCAARPIGRGALRRGGPPRQPMAFFFAVLADLLGLRAGGNAAERPT